MLQVALLSTLRQKKRYILFEIVRAEGSRKPEFSAEEVEREGMRILGEFLGVLGMSRAGVMWVRERCQMPFFVVRCNHRATEEVRAGAILIKKIKNSQVIVSSVRVSGTLKTIGEAMDKGKLSKQR